MSKPPKAPPARKSKEVTGITYTKDFTANGPEEMPSVSRLLNRKMLGLTKTIDTRENQKRTKKGPAQAKSPTAVPPPPIEIRFNSEATPPQIERTGLHPPQAAQAKVQPFNRKQTRGAVQALIAWDASELKTSQDPLARGLMSLIRAGAASALFLANAGVTAPGRPPRFLASAAYNVQRQHRLWKGLAWDPSVGPEVWNAFSQKGFAELAPPATMTNLGSHRNLVRDAFGADKNEWLTLVRIGTPTECRGVLALISKKSLLPSLTAALGIFSEPAGEAEAA